MCVFCIMWESENANREWIAGRFAVGHCTASHCIGLYKEITLKWPKSPFALIYRDGVGGRCDAGRWSQSRVTTVFLCSSSFSFWCFSSSRLQSALLFLLSLLSWLWLSLLLLLEHKNCTQQKVCANVCFMYVCIAANCIIHDAANCCELLLWCFTGSENEPNSMHWMLRKQNMDSWMFMYFLFLHLCFCLMCDKYCCC